ncbi:hypothetical protein GCM10022234_06690 [Aeromicrobium panaciterrae]
MEQDVGEGERHDGGVCKHHRNRHGEQGSDGATHPAILAARRIEREHSSPDAPAMVY